MFKHALSQQVIIKISGEKGHIKGRAEYKDCDNQYQIHYLAADGRAIEKWFSETEIESIATDTVVAQ